MTPIVLCGTVFMCYIAAVLPKCCSVMSKRGSVTDRLATLRQPFGRLVDLGVGSVLTVLCASPRHGRRHRWGGGMRLRNVLCARFIL